MIKKEGNEHSEKCHNHNKIFEKLISRVWHNEFEKYLTVRTRFYPTVYFNFLPKTV
jgi:hypothetical protein